VAQTRYLPYGEERWTGGGTQPTDFTFTGQRVERGFGLMDYNARYYNPRLGRFISADSIVPEPGNPQSLNRYSYVNNSPVRFNDPSGHGAPLPPCAICQVEIDISNWSDLAKDLAVVGSFLTGFHIDREQNLITGPTEQELYDASLTGMVNPIGMVRLPAAGVRNILSRGVERLTQAVRHATISDDAARSIMTRIEPQFLNPKSRFGRAFYVAQDAGTAIVEAKAGNKEATHMVWFDLDIGSAKVLDLTDSATAEAWGYVHDAAAEEMHRSIGQRALESGYDVIKFESFQVPGTNNYAVLQRFEDLLIPLAAAPVR